MSEQQPSRPRTSPYRDQRKSIAAVAAIALVTGAFETATIVAIVAFIDGVTNGNLQWEVTAGPLDLSLDRTDLSLLAVAALVGLTIGSVASAWLRARATANWQYKLQMRAMQRYMAAGWATQSTESSGSLQNLMNMCSATRQGLIGLMTLLTSLGAVTIFAIAAFVASPLAAGALIAAGVALMLLLRPVRTASQNATRAAADAQRLVADDVGEIHGLAQEIRVFHAEEPVQRSFRQVSQRWRASRHRAGFLTSIGTVIYRTLGLGFVLVAAIVASSQTEIDIARVGVAGLLLLRSLSYGQGIQGAWQQMHDTVPYLEQVDEALERYDRSTVERGTRSIQALDRVELRDVGYTYSGGVAALSSVDLCIERGETLGVVGPSGSGKSTLAQILLSLREPTSGSYLADGVPVREISPDSWFRRVAVVPQQPRLLRGSVMDNIVFFRPWVGEDDARRAAVSAGLHEEIATLPEGYDTWIGEAGRDLSGGQRQRLGIARALAGDPQLLVLDEPTSALDAISESHIQRTLARLKGEVTVVIIAHRLSTLNHCDRLLVLDQGVVHALDTPVRVMRQNDFFREAARMQLVDVDAAHEASPPAVLGPERSVEESRLP